MQVKVRYLVKDSDGVVQKGRECWITKVNGELAFGTIYTQKGDDLDQQDLSHLRTTAAITEKFEIIEVIK